MPYSRDHFIFGLQSERPSPSTADRLFIDVEDSAIYLDDGTNWILIGSAQLNTKTTGTTVSNTTDQTDLFTAQIPAGWLNPSDIIVTKAMGNYSTANNSDTVDVGLHIDGNTIATLTNVGGNVTDAAWFVSTEITVRSTGGSAKLQPHTTGQFDGDSTDQHKAEQTIDTTSDVIIKATAQWSAADAGNSLTCGQGYTRLQGHGGT